MLKQRVTTALWLLPLAMAAIFAMPAQWFLILMGVILLGGSGSTNASRVWLVLWPGTYSFLCRQ